MSILISYQEKMNENSLETIKFLLEHLGFRNFHFHECIMANYKIFMAVLEVVSVVEFHFDSKLGHQNAVEMENKQERSKSQSSKLEVSE